MSSVAPRPRTETLERLRSFLLQRFGAPLGPWSEESELQEVFALDSVEALRTLAAVERHFHVRLADADLAGRHTLRSLTRALARANPERSS